MITIRPGVPAALRAEAAALYWQAFANKLSAVMRPEAKAIALLNRVIDPDYALSALDDGDGDKGRLLGLAGFKTNEGAFVGGQLADLRAVYGGFGGLWRGLLLDLLERDVAPGRLLMDGICVHPEARGQGVGTALLDAIAGEARRRGLSEVRLDVIDSNPRARALYERAGFHKTGTIGMGPLRWIFGFRQATTMIRPVTLSSGRQE